MKGRLDPEDVEPDLGRFGPVLGAFVELSTERQYGMSVGPIPMSAIESYLSVHKLPDWWAQVITGIDRYFLASINEVSEAS